METKKAKEREGKMDGWKVGLMAARISGNNVYLVWSWVDSLEGLINMAIKLDY